VTREQVVTDRQNGVAHGHNRTSAAASRGEPAIVDREITLLRPRPHHEPLRLTPGAAMDCPGESCPTCVGPALSWLPGHIPAHEAKRGATGERCHIHPDLGNQHFGNTLTYPGIESSCASSA